MTVPANTQTTYDSIGNREDLINKIYMVEQTQTPFTGRIAKVNATATKHEWQTDALAAAAANIVLEGDDATTDAAIATTRLSNFTQISDKVARVTGTQEAVDKAGRNSEMAYQRAKKMTELKRDIELASLANNASAVGNNSTGREAAGIEAWIATNDDFGATGASPTGDGTDGRTDGTQRAYAEADLKTVLAGCADAGANPNLILLGSFNKQAMSAFTGNNITRNVDSAKAELATSIDIYVSDFGRLEIIFSPQSRSRSALVIDTTLFAMATLPGRSFMSKPLAKTGDSERTQVLTEWTLESRNEAGSGGVFDLTTA